MTDSSIENPKLLVRRFPTLLVIVISAAIGAVGYLAPPLLNGLFNLIASLLGFLPPLAVIVVISAVTGVLFIVAFPHVSAQKGIATVKDRIKCNILAIRIYQDELRTVLRSVGGSFVWNMAYLGLNVLPLLVLAVPFVVAWSQMSALYAYDPLPAGREVPVILELRKGVDPRDVKVQLSPGCRLVRRANMLHRVALIVRPDDPVSAPMTIRFGDAVATKTIEAGKRPSRLARYRNKAPWTKFVEAKDPLLTFGDEALPASSFVDSIFIDYPDAPLGFLPGGEIPIMIIFVLVSMAVGFGLKDYLGVEI